MISRYRQRGWISGDKVGFISYSVHLNAPDNCIETLMVNPPEPVYNSSAEIIGYEKGEIQAVIHITGTKLPTPRVFSLMFHEFLIREDILWASELEQDMLWELAHATEI